MSKKQQDNTDYGIVFIIMCLLFILGISYFMVDSLNKLTNENRRLVYELKNKNTTIIIEEKECEERIYEVLAKNVFEEYVYELNIFDCTDFSMELVKRLREKGYKSRVMEGNLNGNPHNWVELTLMIEATTGEIISPNNYKDYTNYGGR